MIEVKILVDSIDYDGIAEMLVPLVAEKLEAKGGLVGKVVGSKKEFATNMARKVLAKMSQEKKDELVVELLTKKRDLLMSKAAGIAEKKGIGVQIYDISATKY